MSHASSKKVYEHSELGPFFDFSRVHSVKCFLPNYSVDRCFREPKGDLTSVFALYYPVFELFTNVSTTYLVKGPFYY